MHAGKSGESTPAATKGRRRLGHRLTLWSVPDNVSTSTCTIMTTPSAPLRFLHSRCEHHPKSCLAAHHALVGFSGPLEREDFIHGPHAGERAEMERILGVNRSTRRPTYDRAASAEQLYW